MTAPAKSFTTGWGSTNKVQIWISILRHHRSKTETMARYDAENAQLVAERARQQRDPAVLDLGCGSRAGVVLALGALRIPAVGIDYDVPEPRASLAAWGRIARRNGPERAVKTAARQLAFDRAYYGHLRRMIGAPLGWDKLDVRAGDAHNLAFPDETFSFVHSVTVFEHLSDVPKATAEMARVLRPGGEAYVVAHLYPSPSGGHALDWAGNDAPTDSSVPAWDHLRGNEYPAHVYLNKLRADEYMAPFREHFDVLSEEYRFEHQDLLTRELRAELADWSEEDLTRRLLIAHLRRAEKA